MSDPTNTNPWRSGNGPKGADYDRRFDQLAATGHNIHGEADLVERLIGRLTDIRVLDAGCGTGRVGIELARRGAEVVGIDIDPSMLSAAVAKAPEIEWIEADLGSTSFVTSQTSIPALTSSFDLLLMAGNVMLFVSPKTEGLVLSNSAALIRTGGLVVAGFSLRPGGLNLATYDELAHGVGLELVDRFATWEGDPWWPRSDYAVSVHRLSAAKPARNDQSADT